MTNRLDPDATLDRLQTEVAYLLSRDETKSKLLRELRRAGKAIYGRELTERAVEKLGQGRGHSIYWLAAIDEACRRVVE